MKKILLIINKFNSINIKIFTNNLVKKTKKLIKKIFKNNFKNLNLVFTIQIITLFVLTLYFIPLEHAYCMRKTVNIIEKNTFEKNIIFNNSNVNFKNLSNLDLLRLQANYMNVYAVYNPNTNGIVSSGCNSLPLLDKMKEM